MEKAQKTVQESIKDRFNGVNDPMAAKILAKVEDVNAPQPPADITLTTLYIGDIEENEETSEASLKQAFEIYGKIQRVKYLKKQNTAFVLFFDRQCAEKAISALHDRFFIKGKRLKVMWAKSQLQEESQKKKKKQ